MIIIVNGTPSQAAEVVEMAFWSDLNRFGHSLAVLDEEHGTSYSYIQLYKQAQGMADFLDRKRKQVILLFGRNDVPSILFYLAALEVGHAIIIAPMRAGHETAARLIERFRPEMVLTYDTSWAPDFAHGYRPEPVLNYQCFRRLHADPPPHDDLGVVLLTSGSSGEPKAVKLSRSGIASNAAAIALALNLTPSMRVLGSLPFGYVYGLGVLNSALHAGAAIGLINHSAAERHFWSAATAAGITMLPAVSQTLEYMQHYDIRGTDFETLNAITHSGEPLRSLLYSWIHEAFVSRGVALYLMYGQTEAGGRISVLPPEELPARRNSVGRAVPNGQISIKASGEILYRSESVMLGYAVGRAGLMNGREQTEQLSTGDTGYLDEGFLYITGRLGRDCKVFGRRINLDALETTVGRTVRAAAIENDGLIHIFLEGTDCGVGPTAIELAIRFQIPPQTFRMHRLAELPRGDRGKIAYNVLMIAVQRDPVTPF